MPRIVICGIDPGSEDRTIEIIGRLSGTKPAFVIIDEMHEIKAIRDMAPDPIDLTPLHPEEHGMVLKNGKLVRRHHPIPKTPRSPWQSRR